MLLSIIEPFHFVPGFDKMVNPLHQSTPNLSSHLKKSHENLGIKKHLHRSQENLSFSPQHPTPDDSLYTSMFKVSSSLHEEEPTRTVSTPLASQQCTEYSSRQFLQVEQDRQRPASLSPTPTSQIGIFFCLI